jgi:copper transport protein
VRRLPRRVLLLPALLAISLIAPATAGAHAIVSSTEPARGAALERPPEQVTVHFDEAVESSFGAVRVYDAKGGRVDDGRVSRPTGKSVATGLRDGLPDGPYTVAYRVLSADSHPISGGFTFTVGESGGVAAATVAEVVDDDGAGSATGVAFGVARTAAYAATALLVGGLAFLAWVWAGALRAAGGAGDGWRLASAAFAARVRGIGLVAAATGALACAAGLVLQGAVAAGISTTAALDADVLGDVLSTRFGTVWGLRLVAFVVLGALVALPAAKAAVPAMRPASLGATGLAPSLAAGPALALAALPAAALIAAPALSGHAAAGDAALLVPADVLHVTAMSVWIGGVALALLALPVATGRLEPSDRTRLLAAAVARFSTVALVAVAVLLASGVVQSIVHLESFGDLTGSAFGRAVLVKVALFAGLVALGAYNRRRLGPRLERIAAADEPPARAGVLLRRALRAELALMVAVLGVTGALVSYSPTAGAQAGPFSAVRDLGAARLEMTVEPARVGGNEAHLYLFDRRDGTQYDRAREVAVSATLPERNIGPLPLRARRVGPGHFTVPRADLVPGGDWRIEVRMLVSEFDEFRTTIEVPVR